MKGLIASTLIVLMMGGTAAHAATLYSTSFETSDDPAFTAGADLDGIDNWQLVNAGAATNPAAVITAIGAADGSQFVRLTNGAKINRSFEGHAGIEAQNQLWVEGYFRGTGSTLDLAGAIGTYSGDDASAIVHFSENNGIEFWDGDGEGGGSAVQSAITNLDDSQWYRVSIRLDFNTKNWDVWVKPQTGDLVSHSGLGFLTQSVEKLSGFKNLAQNQSDFDAFRVVRPIPGDANGDSIVDGADIVAMLDIISNGHEDIIVFNNGDLTGNGEVTMDDVDLLVDHLLAQ